MKTILHTHPHKINSPPHPLVYSNVFLSRRYRINEQWQRVGARIRSRTWLWNTPSWPSNSHGEHSADIWSFSLWVVILCSQRVHSNEVGQQYVRAYHSLRRSSYFRVSLRIQNGVCLPDVHFCKCAFPQMHSKRGHVMMTPRARGQGRKHRHRASSSAAGRLHCRLVQHSFLQIKIHKELKYISAACYRRFQSCILDRGLPLSITWNQWQQQPSFLLFSYSTRHLFVCWTKWMLRWMIPTHAN